MRNIKIFKIGGSILKEPENFLKIAKNIINSYKKVKICVVTSAIKGRTDNLINTFKRALPETDFWNFEKLIPMGEIESAIIFESVFNYLNVKSKAILPWTKEWPLYVSLLEKNTLIQGKENQKRKFRILDLSERKTKKFFCPYLKNIGF